MSMDCHYAIDGILCVVREGTYDRKSTVFKILDGCQECSHLVVQIEAGSVHNNIVKQQYVIFTAISTKIPVLLLLIL